MKHKDEIYHCSICNAFSSDEEQLDCPQNYELGSCKGEMIPYLPSSSVKELVEAARDMLLAFDYLITSDKTWQGKAKRKLETALKQFEE